MGEEAGDEGRLVMQVALRRALEHRVEGGPEVGGEDVVLAAVGHARAVDDRAKGLPGRLHLG